ncbi:hypothetical protein ABZP36_009209 [Zizania latifolia]
MARSPMLKTAIGGIMSCVAVQRGRRIEILAFEVANTIAKASNLMASLSEQSMTHLKAVVLRTCGVQCLISDDQNQLLAHVGADIRQKFKEFAADVARFGNVCRDPKWHNLDNNFSSMDYGLPLPVGSGLCQFPPKEYSKEKAESKMKNLTWQAKETAFLFQAFRRLEISDNLYKEEKAGTAPEKERTIQTMENTMNMEKEFIRILKKKSLWAKKMEHIVEELVYIVHFLPPEINRVFPNFREDGSVETEVGLQQMLGPANLHLNYARIINIIKNLSSVTAMPPQCAINSLYEALPRRIISALRPEMKCPDSVDMRTEARLRSEMATTLDWLVPMADSTERLFRCNGMLGEWIAKGDLNREDESKPLKIQSLYYADRIKTEGYIKGMILALHHLIRATRLRLEEMSRERITRDQSARQEAITHDQSESESQEATSSASTSSTGASAGFMDMID